MEENLQTSLKSNYNVITLFKTSKMKSSIIAIGNSKGIRIPKAILQESLIKDHVTIELHKDGILIKPLQETPRLHWESMFVQESKKPVREERLPDLLDVNEKEWKW